MTDEELTLAEYHRALINQRNLYRSQGNGLVNPSISNNTSELAGLDTGFNRAPTNPNETDLKPQTNQDILSQIFGFVDDIAAKFGAGFVGAFEGIADLALTGVSALGEGTGWYDTQDLNNFIKTDYASRAAEWTKTYGNFTPWGLWKSGEKILSGDTDYARNFAAGVFGGPAAAAIQTFREDPNVSKEKYGYAQDQLANMGQVGEFIGGAAHSIGFMLPSIMTAGVAGAAGVTSQVGLKAISLGSMGLSAAGKGGEEAMNQGASAGQALGYGAASGAIEVASEIFVGPVLSKIGLGTGAVAGVVGKKVSGSILKKSGAELAKTIAKTAFEEGMEEVFSGALEPLARAIYQGAGALDEYKDPKKFIIGNGPLDSESLLGQFASGAFVGGLTGGISEGKAYKKLGSDGYLASHALAECLEDANVAYKLEKAGKTSSQEYKQATEKLGKSYAELAKYMDKFYQEGTKEQFKEFAKLLDNPQAFRRALVEDDVENYIKTNIAEKNDVSKISLRSMQNRFNAKFGLDTELVFKDLGNSDGYIQGDKIYLNEKTLSKKGGEALFHDYFGHNLMQDMDSKDIDDVFKDVSPKLKNQVADTYWSDPELKLPSKFKTLEDFKKSDYFKEEVISHYLQKSVKGKTTAQALGNIERALKPRLLQKLISKFSRNKYQSPKLLTEYVKTVNKLFENLNKKVVVDAAEKYARGLELNAKEEYYKKSYEKYFENFKKAYKGLTKELAYSKPLKSVRIYNGATIYTHDGEQIYEHKIKKNKDGSYTATIKSSAGTKQVINYENYETLKSTYRSYVNISSSKKAIEKAFKPSFRDGAIVYVNDTKEVLKTSIKKNKNNSYSVNVLHVDSGDVETKKFKNYALMRKYYDNFAKLGTTKESARTVESKPEKVNQIKTSPIEGKYYIGNKITKNGSFKIQKVGKHFEVVFNDQVLTEAEVGGKNVTREITTTQTIKNEDGTTSKIKTSKPTIRREGGTLVKFDSIDNVKKYLEDVNAHRYDRKDWRKFSEPKAKKAVEVEDKSVKVESKTAAKEKVVSSPKTETFKSVATTRNIIDKAIDYVKGVFGNEYKVVVPINMNDFASKTFTSINEVKSAKLEAGRLVNKMLETTIEKNQEFVGTLEELLDDEQIEALKKATEEIITSSPDTEARSKATRNFETQLDKTETDLDEAKDSQSRIRVLTRLRDRIRKRINRFGEITENEVAKNGLNALLDPFEKLSGAQNGGFQAKGFKDSLEVALNWYTEENVRDKYPGLVFDAEVRQALLDVYDSLGEGVQKANGVVRKNLTADSMQKAIRAIRFINVAIKGMVQNHIDNILPTSKQTLLSVNRSDYGTKGGISRYFRTYKRGFAPAYVVLEEILGGNSELARMLTFDMQMANNKNTLYVSAYHDLINTKLKELKIKKTLGTKKISFRDKVLTADQMMGLYLSTKVQANYDAIEKDGVDFFDDKTNKVVELAKPGEAEQLKNDVQTSLPKEYQRFADWLLDTMNDSVKHEYIDWFEQKYGKFAMRNEIGEIKDNSYWTLLRSYQKMDNLTKAVSNPDAVFSRSKSRTTGGGNAVMITGALSTFDTYISQLGREFFVKPIYDNAISVFNTKVNGKTLMDTLTKRVEAQDIKYLKDTLASILGVNQRQTNMLDKMVAAFSVAKLSLNVGSMLKQFASIWTSNLPFRKSTKALIYRMFNSEMKSEFKTLIDGVKNEDGSWKIEPLGGLKYREAGKGVLKANADSVGKITEKIADFGMIGISKVDTLTMSTGVYSLMVIAQDQFKYKIGSQENIDWVKQHWAEFELSQIGNGALSKNYISRSDNLTRYLFGFLQGATRAAIGSQIHKYGLWKRNKGVNKQMLQTSLKAANEKLKVAEAEYKANQEDAEIRDRYIEAKTEVKDLENRLRDYESFEVAGGKSIPFQMVAGILAQGVFVALINALMKRIKGKKDWDEMDVAEEAMNLALAVGVDWIPLVNFVSNMFQGYEVSIPAVNLLNQMTDIISSGKNGNWRQFIRQIVMLSGDMTGIPVQTLYQYIYGTLKTFDPAIAYETNAFLYNVSPQSTTKTMNQYVEKGNSSKVQSILKAAMDNFRVVSSDSTRKEIADLLIQGYNPMPKQYITEYKNDDGETIKLNAGQIQLFRQLYNQAEQKVSKIISKSEYRKLTGEEKSKLLKKLYDAYFDYSKMSVTKSSSGISKLGKLLASTSGKVDLSRYLLILNNLSKITETSRKTRKELVIAYVNKLTGLSKQEKLLILNLAGYSTSDKNKNALVSFLTSKGMKQSEAKEFAQ